MLVCARRQLLTHAKLDHVRCDNPPQLDYARRLPTHARHSPPRVPVHNSWVPAEIIAVEKGGRELKIRSAEALEGYARQLLPIRAC